MFEFTSSIIVRLTDDALHIDLNWYRYGMLIHMIIANEYRWTRWEHIIDEDFHGEFDENLFQDLVVDDIVDPDLNIDIPNMEGARQGAGQQGLQRMVVVDPMRNLPKFSGEKNWISRQWDWCIWWLSGNTTH